MRFFFAIPSNPRRQNYRLFELINRNSLGHVAPHDPVGNQVDYIANL